MKIVFVILLSVCIFASCSDSGTDGNPPDDSNSGEIIARLATYQLLHLRDGEYYALWIKERPDPEWRRIDTNIYNYLERDSVIFFIGFDAKTSFDSISEALITIENTEDPITPGVQVNSVTLENVMDTLQGHFNPFITQGLYYTEGKITFTSQNILDPLAYQKEFYLLDWEDGTPAPSLINLPVLPQGWKYASWYYNNNFTPPHQFLYGTFTNASSNDDDADGDTYPVPGGAKKQPLNVRGGLVLVTVEPMIWDDALRQKGPSPFRLLQFESSANIKKDSAYTMTNTSFAIPFASIRFYKWK